MLIKLNCLSCGHLMVLGDAYADYHGEIRCWGCRGILDVSLKDGRLEAMKSLVEVLPEAPPPQLELKPSRRPAGRETR